MRDVARALLEDKQQSGGDITLILDDVYNGTQLNAEMSQAAAVLTEPEFSELNHLYISGLHKRLAPQVGVGFAHTNNPELQQHLQEQNQEMNTRSLYFAELACSQKEEHLQQRQAAFERRAAHMLVQADAMLLLYNGQDHPASQSLPTERRMNALEAIAEELSEREDIGMKTARARANEITASYGVPGVEVVPRNLEANIGGYFLEAVYDESVKGTTISGTTIDEFSDLTVAVSQQPTGASFLAGDLMGYGGDFVTRMPFTDPMGQILDAVQSHHDAMSQVLEPQTQPLIPPTEIGAGKAKVLEDQAVSKSSNIQM